MVSGPLTSSMLTIGSLRLWQTFSKEISLARQQNNFLLSITHELKSPIASIQLIIQTFQRRNLDEVQQTKLLNSATVEAERLND